MRLINLRTARTDAQAVYSYRDFPFLRYYCFTTFTTSETPFSCSCTK